MSQFYIVAIRIDKRKELAAHVQTVLTEFGCIIKTRLGLHEAGNSCSNQGLILMEVTPEPEQIALLVEKLSSLDGVNAKVMEI